MGSTIRTLRIKTTVLVTLMVGVILSVVLVVEYLNAYNLQAGLISTSLQGSIGKDNDVRLQMGQPTAPIGASNANMSMNPPSRHSSVLMSLVVEVTSDRMVVAAKGDSIEINTTSLTSVVDRVFQGEVEGTDKETNLAWLSMDANGNKVIAVVDTSSCRDAMIQQAYTEIIVFCASIAMVAIMAWMFSWFAVRPVAEAWTNQQRFIADASHELKTPLAVIKANMSIIKKDPRLSSETERWVDSTDGETDRMSSLITDMLELARSDESAGMPKTDKRTGMALLDLSQLVEETAMELDAMAFERGHSIEEEINEGIKVIGNKEKLSRVIRILVDNATKYGKLGNPVLVTLKATKRHAILAVHNDGNPIAKEDLEHVFDRFYRTDKARTADENKSFGLGLPIAKSIAESHGGRMTVTSDTENGTTFTMMLRLPRDKKQA